eukprot:363169-Chlamydomonas_euryale.AAC.33
MISTVPVLLAPMTCVCRRCRDVLIYPVLQRHRYFRIKAEMPGVVTRGHACAASAAALSMCILHVFPGVKWAVVWLHHGS